MKYKIYIILISAVSISYADCKIVKNTYRVTQGTKTCEYIGVQKQTTKPFGIVLYDTELSPLCKSFTMPLRGKKIKEETLVHTSGKDCSYPVEK